MKAINSLLDNVGFVRIMSLRAWILMTLTIIKKASERYI